MLVVLLIRLLTTALKSPHVQPLMPEHLLLVMPTNRLDSPKRVEPILLLFARCLQRVCIEINSGRLD